jgi:tripartite-type tricarboxylate transporter receptor subunit TctC
MSRIAANYMPDLLGGQVQVSFSSVPASIELIRTGKLRALAVTPSKRLPTLPNTPAMAEFVSGYDASSWYGVSAPRSTPVEIVNVLNKETNVTVADPAFDAKLAALGNIPMAMTPSDFGKFIAGETEKWEKVVRFAGLKA